MTDPPGIRRVGTGRWFALAASVTARSSVVLRWQSQIGKGQRQRRTRRKRWLDYGCRLWSSWQESRRAALLITEKMVPFSGPPMHSKGHGRALDKLLVFGRELGPSARQNNPTWPGGSSACYRAFQGAARRCTARAESPLPLSVCSRSSMAVQAVAGEARFFSSSGTHCFY